MFKTGSKSTLNRFWTLKPCRKIRWTRRQVCSTQITVWHCSLFSMTTWSDLLSSSRMRLSPCTDKRSRERSWISSMIKRSSMTKKRKPWSEQTIGKLWRLSCNKTQTRRLSRSIMRGSSRTFMATKVTHLCLRPLKTKWLKKSVR